MHNVGIDCLEFAAQSTNEGWIQLGRLGEECYRDSLASEPVPEEIVVSIDDEARLDSLHPHQACRELDGLALRPSASETVDEIENPHAHPPGVALALTKDR